MKKQDLAVSALLVFALWETALAFSFLTGIGSNSGLNWEGVEAASSGSLQIAASLLWIGSVPLATFSWIVLGVTFFRKGVSQRWRELGFDKDVFELMVKTRGAWSRLNLLNHLNEPRHRAELAALTGLDWREVDREVELLEHFGLIRLHAHAGAVKIYTLSEQGRVVLELVKELEMRRKMVRPVGRKR